MSTFGVRPTNPAALPPAVSNFCHGSLVTAARRTLFVSGQVAWADGDGKVPEDFDSQCRLVWRHIVAVLADADMDVRNLAKITIYLSDRRYREAAGRIREEFLGDHPTALTIIITDIYSEHWFLEIEAVAVDG
jgi:2-iminobutanoate/2-iminopropanoate deaminase